VLAYGFTENRKFWAKTDRNSIFLGREPRIAKLLSITVPYLNFYGFWKISHFRTKSIGVSLRFYRKSQVWGKNWLKLHISWSRSLYCETVIYNGPVFEFLWVLKNFTFSLEIHRWAYGFTENCQIGAKTDRNYVFLGRDPRIPNRLSITLPYFNFYGFWKISRFCSKFKGGSLRFYRKLPVWGQKLMETPYFLVVTPVLRIGYLQRSRIWIYMCLKKFTFSVKIQGC
jgi:hypothetical protein